MKVYGGNVNTANGQKRGIFAGSKRALAEVMGGRGIVPYLRNYWCETGNKIEIEAATSQPGVLLVVDNDKKMKSNVTKDDYKPFEAAIAPGQQQTP
jgi:hypothetical protein